MAHHQRVPVGLGPGDLSRCRHAAGARPILDHEAFARNALLKLAGDQSRQYVGAAAGRERYDDSDQLARPVRLGPRRHQPGEAGEPEAGEDGATIQHHRLPSLRRAPRSWASAIA